MSKQHRAPLVGAFGFFDIGSNSVKCLVVDVLGESAEIVYDKAIVSGLGRGLGPSGLANESIQRTFEAIETHLHRVSDLGLAPHYTGVATSAMRDSENGPTFVARLKRDLGLEIQIISGEREAELTWLAVTTGFSNLGRAIVIDIGGGSTEFIVGEGPIPSFRQSLDIGCVRMTDRCIAGDPPTPVSLTNLSASINEHLRSLPAFEGTLEGVGSGSTISTILAHRDRIDPYDPARVHGSLLSRADVAHAAQTLAVATIAERAAMAGISADRAEVIVAGAAILDAAMEHIGLAQIRVSDRGLRFGVMAAELPSITVP